MLGQIVITTIRRSVLLLICALLTTTADAQVFGYDLLALQHKTFKEKKILRGVPKPFAVGILDNTFGHTLEPVKYVLSKSPRYFRVHILDGTCVRNHRCEPRSKLQGYTPTTLNQAIIRRDRKLLKHFKRRVALYRALSLKHKETKFLLSPVLEHDLWPKAFRILANTAKRVWPRVRLVNNGTRLGERYKGAWLEYHGEEFIPGVEINSLDGILTPDINKWVDNTMQTKIRFYWTERYNCRTSSEWIPPSKRKCF